MLLVLWRASTALTINPRGFDGWLRLFHFAIGPRISMTVSGAYEIQRKHFVNRLAIGWRHCPDHRVKLVFVSGQWLFVGVVVIKQKRVSAVLHHRKPCRVAQVISDVAAVVFHPRSSRRPLVRTPSTYFPR